MSNTRIYQKTFQPNGAVRLSEEASHHIARVLRKTIGDSIILFNGDGNEYTASIIRIDKKSVEVDVTNSTMCDRESPLQIYLAQGIARGEKMDFIVQKAVELGVNKIYPLVTERCNVRLEGDRENKRLRHWQSVITSACEQCGRNRIPEIDAPQTLTQWLNNIKADFCFVLSPHVKDKLPPITITSHMSIALLIGPEGGLSENEIALATQKNFRTLNLGPRILRTETATIAALTALQTKFGDLAQK